MIKIRVKEIGLVFETTYGFSIYMWGDITNKWYIEISVEGNKFEFGIESTQKALRILKFYVNRCTTL